MYAPTDLAERNAEAAFAARVARVAREDWGQAWGVWDARVLVWVLAVGNWHCLFGVLSISCFRCSNHNKQHVDDFGRLGISFCVSVC